MFHHQVLRRPTSVSTLCLVGVLGACGDPTGFGEASTFTANLNGSTTGMLTGTASASTAGDWTHESVVQVTLPNGGTFSGIVLAATSGSAISFIRSGTALPAGTHRLGRVLGSGFSAGYVVRRSDGLQLFMADSGTVTIAESGSRVTGSFMLYASAYDVIPMPTPAMVGKPLTVLERGTSPLTISGTFNAGRR
jgi:hypothetical protein